MAQDRKFQLSDIARGIGQGLTRGDEERAAQFERLQFVRNAKATSIQREHTRLSAKYGADHPRVVALANKSAANLEFLRDVVSETIRARTEIPVVDKNTWVLHGYVRDRDRAGLAHLTVALYDENCEWVQELGHACTAANGYFRIDVTFASVRGQEPVYIRVLNNRAEHLYGAETPLMPAPGQLDYREIILSGEIEICAPPPDKDRKEPPTDPNAWVVRGQITDSSGKGVSGVTVNLSDEDRRFADKLGQTNTDAQGNYSLVYNTKDFPDLVEKQPAIFLKVLDSQKQALHTSKPDLRFEAGRVEIINVKLEKARETKPPETKPPETKPPDTKPPETK